MLSSFDPLESLKRWLRDPGARFYCTKEGALRSAPDDDASLLRSDAIESSKLHIQG